MSSTTPYELYFQNVSNNNTVTNDLYPIEIVIPFTLVYTVIFITGVVGNISTCIVIAKNKIMHTATNYYLFSLAVSDLLLLISALPPEMYRIWSPYNYIFGSTICFLQGFSAETSANATVSYVTFFVKNIFRHFAKKVCHFSHFRKIASSTEYTMF